MYPGKPDWGQYFRTWLISFGIAVFICWCLFSGGCTVRFPPYPPSFIGVGADLVADQWAADHEDMAHPAEETVDMAHLPADFSHVPLDLAHAAPVDLAHPDLAVMCVPHGSLCRFNNVDIDAMCCDSDTHGGAGSCAGGLCCLPHDTLCVPGNQYTCCTGICRVQNPQNPQHYTCE